MTYTGQNLKLDAVQLGLKNISISNRLDNGHEEKSDLFYFYRRLAWHAIYLWL